MWALFNEAPIYEALETFVTEAVSDTIALGNLMAKMRETGHQLVRGMRGNDHGLSCLRCHSFHNHKEFGKWAKPCRPKQSPKEVVDQQGERNLKHNLELQNQFAMKRRAQEFEADIPPLKQELFCSKVALACRKLMITLRLRS